MRLFHLWQCELFVLKICRRPQRFSRRKYLFAAELSDVLPLQFLRATKAMTFDLVVTATANL